LTVIAAPGITATPLPDRDGITLSFKEGESRSRS
jgi:hypothetical protein